MAVEHRNRNPHLVAEAERQFDVRLPEPFGCGLGIFHQKGHDRALVAFRSDAGPDGFQDTGRELAVRMDLGRLRPNALVDDAFGLLTSVVRIISE